MSQQKQIHRVAYSCLGLGICAFIFISLASFSINDRPNPDVASSGPATNLCGPLGASLAYYCQYYLGPASMPLLLAIGVWLMLYCMGKAIEQLMLRIIGVVLIGAAFSAGSYLMNNGGPGSLTHGNGGILGIALGHYLLSSTASIGAFLVIIAALVVGALLAADNIIFMLPRALWQLSEQFRKAGPLLATVGAKTASNKPGLLSRMASAGAAATLEPPAALADDDVQDVEESQEQYEEQEQDESDQDDDQPVDTKQKAKQANKAGDEPEKTPTKILSAPVVSALAQMLGHKSNTKPSPGGTVEDYSNYSYPPMSLLDEPMRGYSLLQEKAVKKRAKVLEDTLREFKLETEVVATETGPVITMFELKLAPGIKVSQITNLANDMARSLGSPMVRVVAPIPGKHTIGIEVPNSQKETVRIKELLQLAGNKPSEMQIPLFLGKDASGEALITDLATMPHCLIAGTTGSGKSVCINSIITSILLTQRPDMVKLILIDPKMVEMSIFCDIPHLMCPIVTEMKRAEQILEWLTEKMDQRYSTLSRAQVRNIVSYNKLDPETIYARFQPATENEKAKVPLKLPYIVVIIDELADLMMTSAKEMEGFIVRLAQKSRAVGIHLVLATQRPQATVVTGLIKSNMPSRISFRVAARMDSRIVLDQNGAETLLGQGDMLFLKPGTSDLIRSQGTFMGDDEVRRIVKYLKEVTQPHYHPELVQINQLEGDSTERDELFDDAVRLILESKRGSVSLLQRRLTIGYSRASRLVDQMATAGIVGEYKGSQAREVLMTLQEYEEIRRQMEREAVTGYKDLQEQPQAAAVPASKKIDTSPDDGEDELPEQVESSAGDAQDGDYSDDDDEANDEDEEVVPTDQQEDQEDEEYQQDEQDDSEDADGDYEYQDQDEIKVQE